MKETFLIGTILCLLVLGSFISLRSGGLGVRALARSFSAMFLRVVGYVAGLLAVQRMIGSPSLLDW